MISKLISELDKTYDVISCEKDEILVISNRKFDFSFKAYVENICLEFSRKNGVELDPIFDIDNRKYIYANIKMN